MFSLIAVKPIIKYLFFYIVIVLISNCASIGRPGGGPSDSLAPYLLKDQIIPSSNLNVSENQTIKLFFNERILPNSAIGSVRIEPEMDVKIDIKSDAVFITPKTKWNGQFKIFISRHLSDYHHNKLLSPIELLFSTSDLIIATSISGNLFNADSTKVYEVAIINRDYEIISKTEADNKGTYRFSGVNSNPQNILLAIENRIYDTFIYDIRNSNYGISNKEITSVYNPIYISKPIYRSSINNISLVNKHFGKINLSDGTQFLLILNNPNFNQAGGNYMYRDHSYNDSLRISIRGRNHLEEYIMDKTVFLSEDVIDTIPPTINQKYSNDSLFLEFSEPILIDLKKSPFYSVIDSNNNYIAYEYLLPHLIYLDEGDSKKINIHCPDISDLNNNILCDSLITLYNLVDDSQDQEKLFGKIKGDINYSGKNKIIVEVINLDTDQIFRKNVLNNSFIFKELPQGDYQIWAYEHINLFEDSYFSGTLEPIKMSAKFSFYDEQLYVRANWTNTISIDIK